VVTNARATYTTLHARLRVHGHPAFPTPSLGVNSWQPSGVSRREIAKSRLLTFNSHLDDATSLLL
jgi:hypothetical protein